MEGLRLAFGHRRLKPPYEESYGLDTQDNEQSKLRAGETIDVPAVWVTELYGPSTVAALADGLHQLGWDRGRGSRREVGEWLRAVRRGQGGGWTSVGFVVPSGRTMLLSEHEAPLPDGCRAAFPRLSALTPTLTSLTICFLLDDQVAQSLMRPMRADYVTLHLPSNEPVPRGSRRSGWTSVWPPWERRRREVERLLSAVRADCKSFMFEAFPGLFAGGLAEGEYPTADLLLTGLDDPAEEFDYRHAFSVLGIGRSPDRWESPDWDGVGLYLPHPIHEDQPGLALRFAANRWAAFPRRKDGDSQSNWAVAHHADDFVKQILEKWAVTCALDGYRQRLAVLRDQASGTGWRSHRPVRDLRTIRRLVLTDALGAETAARDAKHFAGPDAVPWELHTPKFFESDHRGRQPRNLLKMLREGQLRRAAELERDEEILRSALSTVSNLTGSVSNIRLQRVVILATALSLVVALLAFVAASDHDSSTGSGSSGGTHRVLPADD